MENAEAELYTMMSRFYREPRHTKPRSAIAVCDSIPKFGEMGTSHNQKSQRMPRAI